MQYYIEVAEFRLAQSRKHFTFEDLEEKPKKIVGLKRREKKNRTLLYFFKKFSASGTFSMLLGPAGSKDNVCERKKAASF